MKNLIKHIPNVLTSIRGIISIPIVISGLSCNYLGLAILIAIGGITDFFDGKIARKYNTTNDPDVILNGANLDAIVDKIFVLSTAIALSPISLLSISFIPFELIIGFINSKFSTINKPKTNFIEKVKFNLLNKYNNNDREKPKSSIIGKIKTLFIILSLISISIFKLVPELLLLTQILSGITISLQTIAIGDYLIKYNKAKKTSDNIIKSEENSRTYDEEKIFDHSSKLEELYKLKEIYTIPTNNEKRTTLIKK